MLKTLVPGNIGIHGRNFSESIALARSMQFDAITLEIKQQARLVQSAGLEWCREQLASAGIQAGYWIVPDAWKLDEAHWRELLTELPELARCSADLGCTYAATYFSSGSDERDYSANLRWHAERLRPVAQILADHGIAFGMEYMGPRSVRRGKRFEFIHNLPGLMELATMLGTGNAGVLLDAWHLFTSGGTASDIRSLRASDVAVVHISDAPPGLGFDDYQDCVRRLPLETGVIDLPAFMRELAAIGYTGPVALEPLGAPIHDLAAQDTHAAAQQSAEAMHRLWQLAGLSEGR
jgi:sugar phosphate isomerase/epimerase